MLVTNLCSKDSIEEAATVYMHTIDFVANALISLMALGARFLNVTPCSCK